jgi:hypothetical protein
MGKCQTNAVRCIYYQHYLRRDLAFLFSMLWIVLNEKSKTQLKCTRIPSWRRSLRNRKRRRPDSWTCWSRGPRGCRPWSSRRKATCTERCRTFGSGRQRSRRSRPSRTSRCCHSCGLERRIKEVVILVILLLRALPVLSKFIHVEEYYIIFIFGFMQQNGF